MADEDLITVTEKNCKALIGKQVKLIVVPEPPPEEKVQSTNGEENINVEEVVEEETASKASLEAANLEVTEGNPSAEASGANSVSSKAEKKAKSAGSKAKLTKGSKSVEAAKSSNEIKVEPTDEKASTFDNVKESITDDDANQLESSLNKHEQTGTEAASTITSTIEKADVQDDSNKLTTAAGELPEKAPAPGKDNVEGDVKTEHDVVQKDSVESQEPATVAEAAAASQEEFLVGESILTIGPKDGLITKKKKAEATKKNSKPGLAGGKKKVVAKNKMENESTATGQEPSNTSVEDSKVNDDGPQGPNTADSIQEPMKLKDETSEKPTDQAEDGLPLEVTKHDAEAEKVEEVPAEKTDDGQSGEKIDTNAELPQGNEQTNMTMQSPQTEVDTEKCTQIVVEEMSEPVQKPVIESIEEEQKPETVQEEKSAAEPEPVNEDTSAKPDKEPVVEYIQEEHKPEPVQEEKSAAEPEPVKEDTSAEPVKAETTEQASEDKPTETEPVSDDKVTETELVTEDIRQAIEEKPTAQHELYNTENKSTESTGNDNNKEEAKPVDVPVVEVKGRSQIAISPFS